MSDDVRPTLKGLFSQYGVRGEVRVALPVYPDEAVFVVSTAGAVNMREDELVKALMQLLQRKVWVATDDPVWDSQTIPLDKADAHIFVR